MKRDLFVKLKEGMDVLAAEREGKATLPQLKAGKPEPVEVNSSPEPCRCQTTSNATPQQKSRLKGGFVF
ncbi:hypothetical protein [Ralstonia pickettii]|uniref:hypothetical protein n=1 Tax=Ralstonia pickettii TaxID=329 RepID=UPI001564D311|nr:hypothetical protein [Ralstonia pickettii]